MNERALDRTILLSRDFVSSELDDAVVERAFRSTRVCIVADARNLASVSGQALVTTLGGLALAMACPLGLVFPEVEVRGHQPPVRGRLLRAGMVDLASDFFPGGRAEPTQVTRTDDLVFVIGDTAWRGAARHAWRLDGSAWSGSLAPPECAGHCWVAEVPIGALCAAALAAAEPFKAVMRGLGGRSAELEPTLAATVRLGDDTLDASNLDLGHVDCISGGAITQAFAHAIFRVPGIRSVLRVFEPDFLSITNFNRYLLARLRQCGAPKTQIIADTAPHGVRVEQLREKFTADSLVAHGPLADRVVVGTDNIPSRWVVQSARPGWLVVGATAHFFSVASEHDAGGTCARCMHPRDDGIDGTIPTVSFVSYWAGLMAAARLLQHACGVRRRPEGQATLLQGLHLDGRYAMHQYAVPRQTDCLLSCAGAL